MLPDNIDLTEHRDFGNLRDFLREEILSHEPVHELIDSDFMDINQWGMVSAWEKVFGKRHRNEKWDVFKWDFHKKFDGTCARCGRPIVPWGGNELCKECNNGLEKQLRPFPWFVAGAEPWMPADERIFSDLFDMR